MIDRMQCTGCSACAIACSQNAIDMRADHEGFLRPHVDAKLCVRCGACEKVCPCIRSVEPVVPRKCYAVKAVDSESQLKSSSGGLFFEVARFFILSKHGIVYGCAYDSDLVASHIRVETIEELERLRDSKYVQSDQTWALRDAVRTIRSGREVLYSGTPCQIAGLKSIVGENADNLFTVEITCHGGMSPLVFEMFKREKERQFGERLAMVSFKSKSDSWLRHKIKLTFVSRRVEELPYSLEPYIRAFEGRFGNRPCCHSCHFNAGASGSDLTIGDFWGVQDVHPKFFSDNGVSFALIRTDKGRTLLDCAAVDVLPTEFDKILPKNPDVCRCESMSLDGHLRFYGLLRRHNLKRTIELYYTRPLWKRAIGKAMRLLGIRK